MARHLVLPFEYGQSLPLVEADNPAEAVRNYKGISGKEHDHPQMGQEYLVIEVDPEEMHFFRGTPGLYNRNTRTHE